mgnify:CR=1 FL=1
MKYIIYTDGAYSQKNNEGAYAFVIMDDTHKEIKRFAQKVVNETNNRAELKAIIIAIADLPKDAESVEVFSDSMYALNTLSGRWKRKMNLDLFDLWDKTLIKSNVHIKYTWVKGHNGNEYNELCDRLCNEAVGYDMNADTDRKKRDMVTITRERYDFLLRCEKYINEFETITGVESC